MSDTKKQKLVFSILQFLEQSIKDGTIKPDDVEGIEVAVQCIGEAFGVDPQNPEHKALYATKHSLLSIFSISLQAEEKLSARGGTPKSAPIPVAETKPIELTEEQKKKAEELKSAGNKKVQEKDYKEAVQLYNEAILINSDNAVYYANRAAAYSQMGEHEKAIEDATKSTQIDPSYSKAYSRLGHAYYSINKYKEAVEAYEKGLSLDPQNASMKTALATAEQKLSEIKVDQGLSRSASAESGSRDTNSAGGAGGNLGGLGGLGGLAGLAGLGGGGGGAGGMDLASLMNNPHLMSMVNQMMRSGTLNDLLNNPEVSEIANNMMRGGVTQQNVADIMNNPELMSMGSRLAENFNMAGAGSDGPTGDTPSGGDAGKTND